MIVYAVTQTQTHPQHPNKWKEEVLLLQQTLLHLPPHLYQQQSFSYSCEKTGMKMEEAFSHKIKFASTI
jgi:hypothetical protein